MVNGFKVTILSDYQSPGEPAYTIRTYKLASNDAIIALIMQTCDNA